MEIGFVKSRVKSVVNNNPGLSKEDLLDYVMKDVKKSEPLTDYEVIELEEIVSELLDNFITSD